MFVNALDEGAEDDVRRIIDSLQGLMGHAAASNKSLRGCLASRHYSCIGIKQVLSLLVEDQQELQDSRGIAAGRVTEQKLWFGLHACIKLCQPIYPTLLTTRRFTGTLIMLPS